MTGQDGTDRVEAVYRALLRHPDASAERLAALIATDATTVCADLETLAAQGFLRSARTASGYVAVRPDAVREDAIRGAETELDRRRADLAAARARLAAEMDDYYAGREAAHDVDVETVTGLDAIRTRMDEILAGCRREMLAVITDTEDSAEAVDAARDEDYALLDRGVSIRTIYQATVREMPNTWAYAAEMAARGEVIRLSDDIPTRLVIRDRDVAVIPVDPDDLDAGVAVVRSRPIVTMFVTLFELCWARATPAFAAVTDPDGARNRQLLDLLGNGAKDETVARHLGLNVRTVRRDIAALIEELGAQTRFQAGVHATRRGWL